MGSKFGNLGTGGDQRGPALQSNKGGPSDEKACNVPLASIGTTENVPDTKPEVNPKNTNKF